MLVLLLTYCWQQDRSHGVKAAKPGSSALRPLVPGTLHGLGLVSQRVVVPSPGPKESSRARRNSHCPCQENGPNGIGPFRSSLHQLSTPFISLIHSSRRMQCDTFPMHRSHRLLEMQLRAMMCNNKTQVHHRRHRQKTPWENAGSTDVVLQATPKPHPSGGSCNVSRAAITVILRGIHEAQRNTD
jgi:hypothetical protein